MDADAVEDVVGDLVEVELLQVGGDVDNCDFDAVGSALDDGGEFHDWWIEFQDFAADVFFVGRVVVVGGLGEFG